jgi:hypothetical protein
MLGSALLRHLNPQQSGKSGSDLNSELRKESNQESSEWDKRDRR